MTSLFRSEEMALYQLIVAPDAAYECIAELGDLSCVHFRDLNKHTNPFEKKYVNDIQRCADIQQKLKVIEQEIELERIEPKQSSDVADPLKQGQIIEIEGTIDRMKNELCELSRNAETIFQTHRGLNEHKYVLECAELFLNKRSPDHPIVATDRSIVFGFVAGVIPLYKMIMFEAMLWRITRGNVLLAAAKRRHNNTKTLVDPKSAEKQEKVMFLVYYQGEQLKDRVEKTCRGFGANLYPCPNDPAEVEQSLIRIVQQSETIRTFLDATQEHRRTLLLTSAQKIVEWKVQLLKTKAIYATLNMFNTDMSKKSLFAECWIPVSEFGTVQMALRRGTEESGCDSLAIISRKSTGLTPPTHYKTNKLTAGFLEIIHAYGVADYQEMSPASFTVISFPFLFGVMFGDFGHGIILALVGAYMCLRESQLAVKLRNSEALGMLFSGRYIILLMGLFSIYAGLIYNDIFGLSINTLGSSWRVNYDFEYLRNTPSVQLEPSPFNHTKGWVRMFSGNPYTFGIDPIWALAKNKILFLNSMKMKLSIVLGVSQMIFGIFLNLSNIMYFNRRKDIIFDFAPEIGFFVTIFFYLVILIFYKWTHYNGSTNSKWGASCAPSLLVHFINMFLMSYPESPCSMSTFYAGQRQVQTFLLVIGILCMPLMLIPKPFLEIRKRKKRNSPASLNPSSSTAELTRETESSVDIQVEPQLELPEEKPISEIIVDRSIHTIEFFLNSISSTASYLRLWALSLAHAQLSEVLWQMVMEMAFHMNGSTIIGIASFILFFVWSSFTFAILICMEGLSAFLHVLRLHWVEFQSKFYHGEGYNFEPFSFVNILRSNDLY